MTEVKTDYEIFLRVANLAGTDVRLFPIGEDPLRGPLIRDNAINLIRMFTQQSTAVTFAVIDAITKKPLYINGAASISVVPKLVAFTPEPLIITRCQVSQTRKAKLDLNIV